MYDQITVAVAGTGFIGPVHIEALIRLGIRVKGVLGSSSAKSEQTRQSWGLEKAYTSFQEILEDTAIHAVHLAVPNVLHYQMAKKVLLAGKHVMCEKPLAMNTEETKELLAIAKKANLVAGVTYNIRYYPLNLEAKARIQNDDFGTVYSVVGSYVQDWLLYETDYNWRVLAEQGGALRAVADIGTHWIDLVTTITGLEVEAVFADLKTVFPTRKRPKGEIQTFSGKMETKQEVENVAITTEDSGSILFRFKGGAQGMLWVSQTTAGRKNCLRYEIAGAKQSISWNSERPNELWIGHREKPNELLLKDPALLNSNVRPYSNYPGGHNEGFPDTFKQCFRAFYTAIQTGKPGPVNYPTFEDGHKEVMLCEAILESHKNEKWIYL